MVRTPGYYYGPRRVVVGAPYGAYGYRGFGGYYGGRTVVTAGPGYAVESTEIASPTPASGVVTASAAMSSAPPASPMPPKLSSLSVDELGALLVDASASLHARLDLFDGGEGWQSYFETSANGWTSENATDKLLRRFDSVSRQSEFSMIAQLPEFQAVHEILAAYAAKLAEPTPTVPPAPSAGVSVDVKARGANVSVRSGAESIPAPAASKGGAKASPASERSVLIDVR
ncbi:hypothetical protein [Pirellulimonas nuda]|uniref:hypothetical protein n=1 Tax=Pirellulimonas nuda TaxID=2528009 RepID=UPI0011AAEDCA|nr:hypothetical protein [Pirellulimonas nuda]